MTPSEVLGVDACKAGWVAVVPVDDVLDAAAAAWSAQRYATGKAAPLPQGATRGDRPVIWR